jgi:hypothetical protein
MSNLDYLKFGYTLLSQVLNKEQRTDSKLNYRVSQKKVLLDNFSIMTLLLHKREHNSKNLKLTIHFLLLS